MIDSTDFLNLDELPERIVFIGGGFVSFEFAHIAARAGSRPVIVDRGARPLKAFDEDLVELLIDRGSEAGVEVQRGTHITGVEQTSDGYRVSLDRAGSPATIDADFVVHGAGRAPDLSRLNLEAAGVAYDDHGVDVAENLQSTTHAGVYAAGDSASTAGMPLTPAAVIEAKVAASNMLRAGSAVPDYAAIPTAVFTIPEIVRLGMLEDEARESGVDVDVRYTDTSQWFSNYRIGESAGATKILVDESTDRILGAHLFGAGYAELAYPLSMAMKHKLTTQELKSTTAAYPTIGSDLASML